MNSVLLKPGVDDVYCTLLYSAVENHTEPRLCVVPHVLHWWSYGHAKHMFDYAALEYFHF